MEKSNEKIKCIICGGDKEYSKLYLPAHNRSFKHLKIIKSNEIKHNIFKESEIKNENEINLNLVKQQINLLNINFQNLSNLINKLNI